MPFLPGDLRLPDVIFLPEHIPLFAAASQLAQSRTAPKGLMRLEYEAGLAFQRPCPPGLRNHGRTAPRLAACRAPFGTDMEARINGEGKMNRFD
jgi:hypothetical protein